MNRSLLVMGAAMALGPLACLSSSSQPPAGQGVDAGLGTPDGGASDGPTNGDAGDGGVVIDCPKPAIGPDGGRTVHQGGVSGNEIWTAADSPHVVTSGLTINGTLTIEPCAEVGGLSAGLAGTLAELLALLQAWWHEASAARTPLEWGERLRALMAALLLDQPYDEFVRELLTASARSNHYNAPVNFFIRYYVDHPDQSTVSQEDSFDEFAIRSRRHDATRDIVLDHMPARNLLHLAQRALPQRVIPRGCDGHPASR